MRSLGRARTAAIRFRRTRLDQTGTSVVELMVTSAIFMVVLATLLGMLISLTRADKRAQSLANNVDAVRRTTERVARDVRAANPLLATDTAVTPSRTISTNEVIVTSGPSTGTQQVVDWRYDSAAHTFSRCTRTLLGTSYACETVLTSVNLSSSATVFRYFCTSGAELSPAGVTGPGDIAKAGVRVRVTLDAAPDSGPAPVPFQEDAELRNKPGGTGC
jgi:Tfp pilus assembly protein PilW